LQLSHCHNPWLQFKGGRGLLTAAGGRAFCFLFLLEWATIWAVVCNEKKNIILANISSTVLSLLVYLELLAVKYAYPQPENSGY
jgi:glycerol-3-phosphate acyltransferase PlsY